MSLAEFLNNNIQQWITENVQPYAVQLRGQQANLKGLSEALAGLRDFSKSQSEFKFKFNN